MDMSLSNFQETVKNREAWCAAVHGVTKNQTGLSDWSEPFFPSSQSYGFSSSHVWMWELDHKEGWVPENWCLWTGVLEKTLESPLERKEIKPVTPKGNQPWIFIGRTDAEAEALILWPPDAKSWLTGKDPDAGKDGRQKKRVAEDEMVRQHHWLNGCELH